MSTPTPGLAAGHGEGRANKLYFAIWRWHFYAGLYVIPFLFMLAATGLIMLWISVLSGLGDERMTVTPGGTPMALSALQTAAEAAVPGGTATQYVAPLSPGHTAAFAVATDSGKTGVTLNPYTGEVLHSFPWRAGWYDFANDVHGTLMIGNTGDWLIEAAASLALPAWAQPAPRVLRFAWWGAEEAGLVGSTAYVAGLTADEKAKIALYLNFDMVGSPNHVFFIYDGDDSDAEGAGPGPGGSAEIEKTFEAFFKQRGVPFKGTDFSGRSDYGPFIANLIPAGGLFTGAEGIKTAAEAAISMLRRPAAAT